MLWTVLLCDKQKCYTHNSVSVATPDKQLVAVGNINWHRCGHPLLIIMIFISHLMSIMVIHNAYLGTLYYCLYYLFNDAVVYADLTRMCPLFFCWWHVPLLPCPNCICGGLATGSCSEALVTWIQCCQHLTKNSKIFEENTDKCISPTNICMLMFRESNIDLLLTWEREKHFMTRQGEQ